MTLTVLNVLTASGFTLERGAGSVVSRGPATTNSTATTTLQRETRGC